MLKETCKLEESLERQFSKVRNEETQVGISRYQYTYFFLGGCLNETIHCSVDADLNQRLTQCKGSVQDLRHHLVAILIVSLCIFFENVIIIGTIHHG